MSNTTANLEFAAEVIRGGYIESLASRDIMIAHPAIYPRIDGTEENSLTSTIREYAINGADLYAAEAEGDPTSPTTIAVEADSVTVGRRSLVRLISGTALNADSAYSAGMVAQDLFASAMITETSLAASLAPSWAAGGRIGDDATPMSLVTFYEAITQLELANVPGPYLFMGHTVHKAGLRLEQLLNAGGAIQYRQPTATRAAEMGLVGELEGVALYITNLTPVSGNGRIGQMVGRNALINKIQTPSVQGTEEAALANVKIRYDPIAERDQPRWLGHMYTGWKSYIPDAGAGKERGVGIVCRA